MSKIYIWTIDLEKRSSLITRQVPQNTKFLTRGQVQKF